MPGEANLWEAYAGPEFTGERRPLTGLEHMEQYARLNPQPLADLGELEISAGYPMVPGAGMFMNRLRDTTRAASIIQTSASGGRPLPMDMEFMPPGLRHEIMRQFFPGASQSYPAHRGAEIMRKLQQLMERTGLRETPRRPSAWEMFLEQGGRHPKAGRMAPTIIEGTIQGRPVRGPTVFQP